MNAHFDRGALLFEQGRYEDAISAFQEGLTLNPDDPRALMYIGWSFLIQEKYSQAVEYCRMAYEIFPEDELIAGNFAQALFRVNDRPTALTVLENALSLFPHSWFLFYIKAQILYFQEKYSEAEQAITNALEIEPESTELLNLYHQILVKLKKKGKAEAVIDYVLKESPNDSYTHANVGWNYIRQQDTAKAKKSFLEALRIDPDNPYAKEGLKEAIRIENPFYRTIHKFFLWMDKMSRGRQTAIIIGMYILYRMIVSLSRSNPALGIILQPLILLYIVFALSTWVAKPFSNFFLQFNPIGKHILSKDERISANLIGGSFMIALVSMIGLMAVNSGLLLLLYVMGLIFSITLSGAFLLDPKSPYRKLLFLISFGLIGMALLGLLGGEANAVFLSYAGVGILLYTFLVPFLARREAGKFYEAR